jgi:hypothetical protein
MKKIAAIANPTGSRVGARNPSTEEEAIAENTC